MWVVEEGQGRGEAVLYWVGGGQQLPQSRFQLEALCCVYVYGGRYTDGGRVLCGDRRTRGLEDRQRGGGDGGPSDWQAVRVHEESLEPKLGIGWACGYECAAALADLAILWSPVDCK